MADNFVSYERFTAINPNIAQHGVTVEEIQLQRGTPDPNPIASPMANVKITEARLALVASDVDKLRFGTLQRPMVNPYEGPKSNFVLSYQFVRKISKKLLTSIGQVVEEGDFANDTLMEDSLRRIAGAAEYMGYIVKLVEGIHARVAANSQA